jgi:hypothetical protein
VVNTEQITVVLNRETLTLTRNDVIRAAGHVRHREIRTWAVSINGEWLPLNETFRQATHREKFTSQRARDVLRRLRFRVTDTLEPESESASDSENRLPPQDDVPRTTELRVEGLQAAVAYCASRPRIKPSDVLELADTFARWLQS